MSDLAALPLVTAALLIIQVHNALAAVDGLYIHLWKLRLHSRPESYREHLWHTARAILFVPIAATLFLAPTAGMVLYLGVALVAADLAAGILDVLSERDSRAGIGGLSRGEYALHMVLVTLDTAAIALLLASRPAAAWSPSAPTTIGVYPELIQTIAFGMVPAGIAVAALHVYLAWKHRPVAVRAQLAAHA